MKLRHVLIKNFRNLHDVSVPITDTTVLIGENNSGKTGLLDALKLTLLRSQARGNPFDEYDYHMARPEDSPQTSAGITIELWFREDSSDEWPEAIIQALNPIIQTDPEKDIDSIGLRLTSKMDAAAKEMVAKWEFLNIDGVPLAGEGAKQTHVRSFLAYVRLFYLSALRDSDVEFSPRSQFWGRILREMEIKQEQRKQLQDDLEKLNAALLGADPRLDKVRSAIDNIRNILAVSADKSISIQALPLQPWELMSKAQIAIRPLGTEVEFPLRRHGQGMQSLAVLFLFQAYIDVLLKPSFEPETEAILALEEPEAHLHPHASRALAANLGALKSQKIISTHSPFIVQEIAFDNIRMFRRAGPVVKVLFTRKVFSVRVPAVAGLEKFCADRAAQFEYHTASQTLSCRGQVEEKDYRELLQLFAAAPEIHGKLRDWKEDSKLFLNSEELSKLNTYAKRIRGEVLFARAWLLCEGQSEYLLLRYFAELLGTPLDQRGISVIDFQNNGAPGSFVALARVFEIPWIMVCDHDAESDGFIAQLESRGLTPGEITANVRRTPPAGSDLESFLTQNGFRTEYEQIIQSNGTPMAIAPGAAGYDEELVKHIQKDKTGNMVQLIEILRASNANAAHVPKFFADGIREVIGKAG